MVMGLDCPALYQMILGHMVISHVNHYTNQLLTSLGRCYPIDCNFMWRFRRTIQEHPLLGFQNFKVVIAHPLSKTYVLI